MSAYRTTSTAVALLVAAACDSRVAPTPIVTIPGSGAEPSSIAVVSGADQSGKAGEQLTDPFVVRVLDESGNPVNNITVSFRVASGAGALAGQCDGNVRSAQTTADGTATMTFKPSILGRSTVIARISGRQEPSVTFATEAIALVVDFWFGFWNVGFVGPCSNSSDVTVPVGTTVEWRIPVQDDRYPVTYFVTSTSTPPGSGGFDSGMLTAYERFRFVPLVAGTWEYRDRVTGLAGTLTAR
jgi:Bacterial Ig-like domain (group 1)